MSIPSPALYVLPEPLPASLYSLSSIIIYLTSSVATPVLETLTLDFVSTCVSTYSSVAKPLNADSVINPLSFVKSDVFTGILGLSVYLIMLILKF